MPAHEIHDHRTLAGLAKVHETKHYNEPWTEECQGVATDGRHWYISTNHEGHQAVHRFTLGMSAAGSLSLDELGHGHVGALCWWAGRLFIALEKPAGLAIVDDGLRQAQRLAPHASFTAAQGSSFPWVAVDPRDGSLLSSAFGRWPEGTDCVFVYDAELRRTRTLRLSTPVFNVQGGAVTPRGNLVLSSDIPGDLPVFRLSDGQLLGRVPVAIDHGDGEELEGVCHGDLVESGIRSQLHVILLDNDSSNRDDVYFKHYAVDHPEHL